MLYAKRQEWLKKNKETIHGVKQTLWDQGLWIII